MLAQPTQYRSRQRRRLGIDKPAVVVWNDPVNTMAMSSTSSGSCSMRHEGDRSHVAGPYDGRAIVSDGPREKAELDCFRLHNHGLWATLEQ
jgi:ATP-dependent Clp protease adaptor protein ClpS